MRRAMVLSACAASWLIPAASAQGVPFGQHIMSQSTVATTTSQLYLVNRTTSTCTPITGLTATEVEAVQLDGVDKRVWLGTPNAPNLHVISLGGGGTSVSAETGFASVTCNGFIGRITGIAMSANGNPTVATQWCVAEVDRNTGAVNELFNARNAGIPTGFVEGICRDPAGNLYFGLSGNPATAGIYFLRRTAMCTYAAAVRLGSIQPASASVSIQGLEYDPAVGARPARLVWVSRTTNGNNIGTMPPTGGAAVSAGNSPPGSYNWIEYDIQRDDMMLVEDARAGFPGNRAVSLSQSFATSTVCTVATSTPPLELTSIDTGDSPDAQTNIAPECPPTGTPVRIDIGTSCPTGQTAGIFLVAPLALTVAVGPVDATGRLSVGFTTTLPPGFPPGVLVFASACFDGSRLRIGPPKPWPSS